MIAYILKGQLFKKKKKMNKVLSPSWGGIDLLVTFNALVLIYIVYKELWEYSAEGVSRLRCSRTFGWWTFDWEDISLKKYK